MVDERTPGALEVVQPLAAPAPGPFRVETVRWPVLEGVAGEGVLLLPPQPRAVVIALADPDHVPATINASLWFAARLRRADPDAH